HADEAVLHDVDATHAVASCDLVGARQQGEGIEALTVDGDGHAVLEADGDDLGSVGRGFGVTSQLPHAAGGRCPWILEDAALVTYVEQVGVCRIRLPLGDGDVDAVLGGVRYAVLPALQVPLAPRSYDFDVWFERVG